MSKLQSPSLGSICNTYLYENRPTHRSRDSGSESTPLKVILMFIPGRGALGNPISMSCFFKYVVTTFAHSTLYWVGL